MVFGVRKAFPVGVPTGGMDRALAEIEFLALSANRVAVLNAVAERAHSRGELGEVTGASQATLGRILTDFEERAWVERGPDGYVATATGRLVADGFTDLVDVVETEQRLRPVVSSLPTAELSFDLRRLDDATVTVPTETRPNAPVTRLLDLLGSADEVRVFSHAFNEGSLRTVQERVTAGGGSFAGVFSGSAIDALADDAALRRRLAALLAADGADVYRLDSEVPLAVTVADDVVHLLVRDADGLLRASVDTDDPVVHDWALERFASYRETATRLDRGELPD